MWAPFTARREARPRVPAGEHAEQRLVSAARRPGDNLFAESIVCLDAKTGQAQVALSDSCTTACGTTTSPAPPVLVTMTVDGRKIDAVVQLTKQGFAFVFDRVTGTPVWPIEERPVPPSDVPGEHASPTQPFPTKPPAVRPQGVTLDDAFDLTPELKAEAQAALKQVPDRSALHAALAAGDGDAARRSSAGRTGAAARSIRRPECCT